jgi:hypothetical protein
VTLGESIAKIGDYTFYSCDSLESIVFPNSVTEVGNYAFSGCISLSTIKFNSALSSIGGSAFQNCSSLKTIELPTQLVTIGDDCFAGTGLLSLSIPNSVESIGSNAFPKTIEKLIIEDGDTPLLFPAGPADGTTQVFSKYVDGKKVQYRFKYYYGYFHNFKIKDLYIGRNLSSKQNFTLSGGVGVDPYVVTSYDGPFANLSYLERLTIGKGVSELGAKEAVEISELQINSSPSSFNDCDALETVKVMASIPPTGAWFSTDAYENAVLVVPDNSLEQYKEAEGWKYFLNQMKESATGIEEIRNGQSGISVHSEANGVSLSGAEGQIVQIYDFNGRMVWEITAYDGQVIMLPTGNYIISVGNEALKVRI